MDDNGKDLSEDQLDALFAAARSADAMPGDDLVARLLADAEAEQVRFAPPEPVRREAPKASSRWLDWLLWPSGLAAAAVTGLWIGVAGAPELLLSADAFWESGVGIEIAYRLPAVSGLVEGN